MTTAISQSQSTDSSYAFFIRPNFRFVKVTCTMNKPFTRSHVWKETKRDTSWKQSWKVPISDDLESFVPRWRFWCLKIIIININISPPVDSSRPRFSGSRSFSDPFCCWLSLEEGMRSLFAITNSFVWQQCVLINEGSWRYNQQRSTAYLLRAGRTFFLRESEFKSLEPEDNI